MPKISEEKKQIKREYILEVAFELFSQKGYTATGMRDIMKVANISKGGIYVYFKSKTEILLSLVERFDSKRHYILDQLDKSLSSHDMLSQYLRKRLGIFKQEENCKWSRVALEFWSLPSNTPEIASIKDRRYREYKDDIKYIINRGINCGEFRSNCDVDSVVYQIMGTINGIGVLAGSMNRVITDKHIQTAIDMYLYYLKGE
ncbi:TetR/AcrR family transcriptional regulator [Clostridiaceae bacterium M8S5]|nr:TetR/AcrR family transcriptional regulator [Clostridiaceae bacterium M8S5]